MKIGAPSARYASGALYKRQSASVGYAPGSKYKRFGNFGLMTPRNRSVMNRNAIDSYRAAFSFAAPTMFAAKHIESEGISEIAATQVLNRAKQAANALADKAASLSIANGGNGGTGASVDETV